MMSVPEGMTPERLRAIATWLTIRDPIDGADAAILNEMQLELRRANAPGRAHPRVTGGEMAKRTDVERFWSKVDRDGPIPDYRPDLGPCWLWTGWVNPNGYGCFWWKGRDSTAIRFSHEHFVGPIPQDYDVDHLCRVRRCVNPGHLQAVTPRENALRGYGWAGVNGRKTHCPKGHPYSGSNLLFHKRPSGNGSRRCRACLKEERG